MAVSVMPPRWWAGIQHDVIVVAHQYACTAASKRSHAPRQRQEPGAVAAVQEDGLARVATAGDVVRRVRELDAQRPGHGGGAVVAAF